MDGGGGVGLLSAGGYTATMTGHRGQGYAGDGRVGKQSVHLAAMLGISLPRPSSWTCRRDRVCLGFRGRNQGSSLHSAFDGPNTIQYGKRNNSPKDIFVTLYPFS